MYIRIKEKRKHTGLGACGPVLVRLLISYATSAQSFSPSRFVLLSRKQEHEITCKLSANITQPTVNYFTCIRSSIPHPKHKLLWGGAWLLLLSILNNSKHSTLYIRNIRKIYPDHRASNTSCGYCRICTIKAQWGRSFIIAGPNLLGSNR